MTGTSLDGLDAALVSIEGRGWNLSARFIALQTESLGRLRHDLLVLAEGEARPPIHYMRVARRLGTLHADAVFQLCESHLPPHARLDLIAAHGQTIWHAPNEYGRDTFTAEDDAIAHEPVAAQKHSERDRQRLGPLSWQLFDPWPLVRRLNTAVVFDLRGADLIAGGQGAPITPLADAILYRDRATLVVNLGGICNITDLSASPTGEDLCPCNLLIDRTVQTLFPSEEFDRDGALAASGTPSADLFGALFNEDAQPRPGPRSMGREDLADGRIEALIAEAASQHAPCDVIASAVDAVSQRVSACIKRRRPRIAVLAGGGARNRTLAESIAARCAECTQVVLSDTLGIPCEAREAACFAVLGGLAQDGLPVSLPRVTGASKPGRGGVWAFP